MKLMICGKSKCLLLCLVMVSMGMFACGSLPDSISDTRQITKDEYKCVQYSSEQKSAFENSIDDNLIRNLSGQPYQWAINELTGIPPSYMKWLNDLDRFYIGGRPGQGGGVTELGYVPGYLHIGTTKREIELALQHEIGHAMTPYFQNHVSKEFGQKFDADLRKESQANGNNPNLHAYPKMYFNQRSPVYTDEYFAEAFNSYYCSPETNKLVAEQFSSTYVWLESFLEKPVWAEKTTAPSSSSLALYFQGTTNNGTIGIGSGSDSQSAFICNDTKDACMADLAKSNRSLSYLNLSQSATVGARKIFFDPVTFNSSSSRNINTSKPLTLIIFKQDNTTIVRSLQLYQ